MAYIYTVKTGEEHEETIYSTRARLYVMDSDTKDWKERGVGMLRVNTEQIKGVITRSRLGIYFCLLLTSFDI